MNKKLENLNSYKRFNSQNKLLNENFYLQNWIRESLNSKSTIKTTDTSSTLRRIKQINLLSTGDVINTQLSLMSNNSDYNSRVLTNLGFKNPKTNNMLEKYRNSFEQIVNSDNNLVVTTKSIKGGFSTLNLNVNGFFPKSHYIKTTQQLLNKGGRQKTSMVSIKKLTRFLPIRIPLNIGQLTVYPSNEINKFSKNKNPRKYYNKTNLTFITKMNENKKTIRNHKIRLLSKKERVFNIK